MQRSADRFFERKVSNICLSLTGKFIYWIPLETRWVVFCSIRLLCYINKICEFSADYYSNCGHSKRYQSCEFSSILVCSEIHLEGHKIIENLYEVNCHTMVTCWFDTLIYFSLVKRRKHKHCYLILFVFFFNSFSECCNKDLTVTEGIFRILFEEFALENKIKTRKFANLFSLYTRSKLLSS